MRKQNIIFWKNTSNSWLFSTFLLISVVAVVMMLISRHFGAEWVYTWDTMIQSFNRNHAIQSFESGFFDISIEVPIYFMRYHYYAAPLHIPLWASKVWFVGLALAASVLSAAITSFRRIYFLAGATLLICLLISFRTDLIGVWGLYSKWWVSGLSVFIFLGINYYFHTFAKKVSFGGRWLANFSVWLIFLCIVLFFSQEKAPSVFLAGYGMLIPALLCVLTVFLLASELPYLFASLTASYTITGKLNFKSFHLIMIFYVGNLILLYLKNTKILVLDIFYLDDFYILAASFIFGLWGVRHNPLFCLLVPEKLRIWVYTALVLNAALCIAYFHSVANEAAIAALEDFVVYSHLGFGLVFWIYTVFNFRGDQSKYAKMPFATLFYEEQSEKTIPLYLARGMGFMIMGLFIYKENAFAIRQSIGAYYGGLGDIYFVHYSPNNHYLADSFYEDALSQDPVNHRFWYARASLISLKEKPKPNEIADKIAMLELATQRDPQAQDYAHIAQEFLLNKQDILANLEYKEGLEKFPKNPYLSSNIAMILAQNNAIDSALYYFQRNSNAIKDDDEKDANFLSLLIQKPILHPDSVEQFLKLDGDRIYEINRLAVLSLYQKLNKEDFNINFARKNLEDTTILGKIQAAYLYNFLNTAPPSDTIALHIVGKLRNTQSNIQYSDLLNLAMKSFYIKNKQNQKGIESARMLNYISAAEYQFNYAKYLLYLGESQKAALEFDKLAGNAFSSVPYREVLYHTAIAYSESRQENRAKQLWQQIVSDTAARARVSIARKMLQIYNYDIEKWQEAEDTTRFGLVYYRKEDIKKQIEIAKSIKNTDLKVKSFAFLIEKALKNKETDIAQNLFDLLPKDIECTLEAQNNLNLAYLKLLFEKNDKQNMANIIEKIPLSKIFEGYRYFFKAWLLEENKAIDAAKWYAMAIESNPFDLFFYPKTIALQNKLGDKQGKAYDFAIQAIRFKKEDVQAWQIYFEQCLEAQFDDFAQDALFKIKELSPDIYPKYQAIFETKKR